jgi:hypothetical protein
MTTYERLSPIFPVRNVARALEHYRKLGFEADAGPRTVEGDPIYGFVSFGCLELHLSRQPALDIVVNPSACYLCVDDAGVLHDRWRAARVDGKLTTPTSMPYDMLEFDHVDPDGNTLRVGSPLRKS